MASIFRHLRKNLQEIMPEDENDRTTHRTLILTMCGFSFSALIAITAIEVTVDKDLRLSLVIFYLLVSFLCYIAALNLQGYKFRVWHDLIGDALFESGALALLASIIAMIWTAKHNESLKIACTTLASIVWLADHVIRLRLTWRYLKYKVEIEEAINTSDNEVLSQGQSKLLAPSVYSVDSSTNKVTPAGIRESAEEKTRLRFEESSHERKRY